MCVCQCTRTRTVGLRRRRATDEGINSRPCSVWADATAKDFNSKDYDEAPLYRLSTKRYKNYKKPIQRAGLGHRLDTGLFPA